MTTPETEDKLPAPGPTKLDKADSHRLVWYDKLRPGQDYRDALRPEYWYPAAQQLGAHHQILIASHDDRVLFSAWVVSANPHSFPHPKVEPFYQAIMPADLKLPTGQVTAPARWVATQLSVNGNWQVDDVTTGEPVQINLTRRAAQELVGILEAQAAAALEEQKKAKAA
jgi:hypothetical protein